MTMAIGMGAAQNFSLAPAHAHVNLLGWVTLALVAVVFTVWPQTATTRLARVFFWLYNLALPATMLGLSFELLGHAEWMPVLIAGQLALYAAAILFVANIIISMRSVPAAGTGRPDLGVRRQGAAVVADAG